MDEKELRSVYDKAAHTYGAKYDLLGVRAADVERIFELSGIINPFVYEIGCGTGRDASYIMQKACRYKGIDISEEFIAMARAKVPGAHFQQADIRTVELPKEIDIVIAFASLLHFSPAELRTVLVRLASVMNTGGLLFLSLKSFTATAYSDETDEFGTRRFYSYSKEDIETVTKNLFSIEFYEEQVRSESWLSAIVRKL